MNVPYRLILRFLRMRRAYTGQSPPTLCFGACINVHNVRACSCRLSRRQPSHSRFTPVFTNSAVGAKRASQNHEAREQLVAPAAAASPATPPRKSPPAATGFLRTRFVDLQRTAIHVQTVEFSNGLYRVAFGSELHESETPRLARFSIANNTCRNHFVAFLVEQLEQAFVRHVIGEISYIEFCHVGSLLCFVRRTRHRNPSWWRGKCHQYQLYAVSVSDETVDGKSCPSFHRV